MSREWFYDVVASICTETCRTDCHMICSGFKTVEDAMGYINANDISEVDYYKYCRDDETVYIEIEERDEDNNLGYIITVD